MYTTVANVVTIVEGRHGEDGARRMLPVCHCFVQVGARLLRLYQIVAMIKTVLLHAIAHAKKTLLVSQMCVCDVRDDAFCRKPE